LEDLVNSADEALRTMPKEIPCRFCGQPLKTTFVDLGMSPLANSYVKAEELQRPETFFPLHCYLCDGCFLVQLPEVEAPEEIFSDYAYFSSYSESWLRHCEAYVAQVAERFSLGESSQVVEIASNDGYLLQYFQARNVPVLGIEPAANVAAAAEKAGIPTRVRFFGQETARQLVEEGARADLLIGNNVLAHVPGLNDFVAGMKIVLAAGGVLTMEFPHLLCLMGEGQFDTIYHEHYSYFSFTTVRQVFAAHGLTLFDVEELPTHGGSLRIYGRHDENEDLVVSERVEALLEKEKAAGLTSRKAYLTFGERTQEVKRGLLRFLLRAKEEGKTVVGYGAPAKGNTLLNYCGVGPDLLDYTVDRSPHKQGCYLPGTRIPIHDPQRILESRPDYVLILPWNLKEEIVSQMASVSSWGGRFVVAVPEVEVLG